MSKLSLLVVTTTFALAAPAVAVPVSFSFHGIVTGFEYGAAAAADIFTVAPVGSRFNLSFSYDTATAPTFGSATGASYANVPVAAVFTIGGTAFSLPTLNIATGAGPFSGGVRFTLFGNAPFSAQRLAGYQLADFSFTLFDPTGTALPSGALPAAFDLDRFATRTVRPRFTFGTNGETALTLTVDAAAAPVPEPASWAMLLTGFGLIGSVLRRSRRVDTGMRA
jgi:hypothetical protein